MKRTSESSANSMIGRTEKEIMSKWTSEEPLVSIICTAYNHQEFISDTLNGFLVQDTNFPFEIIVNDDCSADKTKDILYVYRNKFPNLIKIIEHTVNQYSLGISPFKYLHSEIRGQYVAVCEGDDYWCDEHKLMKQIKALEENPESFLCIHSAYILKDQVLQSNSSWVYERNLLSFSDIFKCVGQFSPTASYLFRRDLIDLNTALKKIIFQAGVADLFIEIFSAINNKWIVAINEPLSVYRVQSIGSWTERNKYDIKARFKNTLRLISDLNSLAEIMSKDENKIISKKKSEELQDSIVIAFRRKCYIQALVFAITNFNQLNIIHFFFRTIKKVLK